MDKPSTYILSTILLAALINLTLEKNHSDINSVALGTSVNMKERDENMKNITGSAYPLQATPANLIPLVNTNNSGTLTTKDVSNPRNATSSTKICRNIDVRNKVGCFHYWLLQTNRLLVNRHVTASFEKSLFEFSYFRSKFMKKRLAPVRIELTKWSWIQEWPTCYLTGISVVLVIVVPFCKRLVIVNSY